MRVYRVRSLQNGSIEVMLHGNATDAAYVARCLSQHQGATVERPNLKGKAAAFVYLIAKSDAAKPLTAEIAKRLLQQHPQTGWVPAG